MRTVEAIKKEITDAWMQNENLQTMYGFTAGDSFSSKYSSVSIENLICFIVAAAIWTHEKLFEAHTDEVKEYIADMKPHTLRWYVNKVKAFRCGDNLIDGTDEYDDGEQTDDEIEQKKVVKFAAATESKATIYIKVATEDSNGRTPLIADQETALKEYIDEIKDAGVKVELINKEADRLNLGLAVYYNPMVMNRDGQSLADGSSLVEETIKSYIKNLPFNGEYSNMALTDAVQEVEGVKIVQLTSAEGKYNGGSSYSPISVKATPESGYYEIENLTITYTAYESANN